ncbi:hypothetical protein BDQ17DRAFT_1332920 [Cyathus striatus]|nr:hypothetical protein BDQ17DRAFT_1332920 [Cyathus striatus]
MYIPSFLKRNTESYVIEARLHSATLLASSGDNKTLRIWDVGKKLCQQALEDHCGWGLALIYRQSNATVAFHELSNTQLFTINELVESISIDPVHQQLAASSHMGKVKLCSIHRDAVHFYDSYKTILVFFLETGEILSHCHLSDSGTEDWHKVLKSPIFLRHRLHEISKYPRSIQTLHPGGWRSCIQAVNAISSSDRKIITSSSSNKKPTIYVWKKWGYVHEALHNVVGRVHASLNDHKDPTSNTQFGPINHEHNNDNYIEIEDNAVEKSKWGFKFSS